MRRVFRLSPLSNFMLAGVFMVMGVLMLLLPGALGLDRGTNYLVGGWAAFLGIAIIVASLLARIEVADACITKFNALGRIESQVAWPDATELVFLREVTSRQGKYNEYLLKAKSGDMSLTDNFAGWDEVRLHILGHLRSRGVSGDVALEPPATTPSRLKSKRNSIVAAVFVAVWLTLFVLFAAFGGTSYRYTVFLYPAPDGWIVQYTFFNTSKLNSLDFDIERTWLNQTEAETVPHGIRVEHGRRGVTNLWLPKSAASEGKPAHLHSWWQHHSGDNYQMQPMDHDLSPQPGPAPEIPADATGIPD